MQEFTTSIEDNGLNFLEIVIENDLNGDPVLVRVGCVFDGDEIILQNVIWTRCIEIRRGHIQDAEIPSMRELFDQTIELYFNAFTDADVITAIPGTDPTDHNIETWVYVEGALKQRLEQMTIKMTQKAHEVAPGAILRSIGNFEMKNQYETSEDW